MIDIVVFTIWLLAIGCASAATALSLQYMSGARGPRRRIGLASAVVAGMIAVANLSAPLVVDSAYVTGVLIYAGFATVPIWFGVRSLSDLAGDPPEGAVEGLNRAV